MSKIVTALAYSNDRKVMHLYKAFYNSQAAGSDLAYEFEGGQFRDEEAVTVARAMLIQLSRDRRAASKIRSLIKADNKNETFAGPITLILGVGGMIAMLQILDSVKVNYKKGPDGKKELEIKYEASGRIIELIKAITGLVEKMGVRVSIHQEVPKSEE